MTVPDDAPWVCRLYPERGSYLYVRVQVWPTKAAFLAHVNDHHRTRHGNRFGPRTQGTCGRHESYRFASGRPRRKSPCVAEVNLWRGKLGIGVITHEFLHATIAWANRVNLLFAELAGDIGATEERICYAHGELCRQFTVKGMRPGGIYTDADLVKSA